MPRLTRVRRLTSSRPRAYDGSGFLRRRERGASMVEFALSAGMFFTIILGIIDFGLTLYDVNATSAGAREGAHSAAAWVGTSPTAPTSCEGLTAQSWDNPGIGDQTQTLRIICHAKSRLTTAGGSRSRVRVRFEDSNGTTVTGGLVSDSTTNRFIVVCVQVQARSITGFFGPILNRLTLMSRSRYRLEYSPVQPPFDIASGGETFFDTAKVC